MEKRLKENVALFLLGGLLYYHIEVLWRGFSHISMIFCGGFCFLSVGKIAGLLKEKVSMIGQMVLGALSITGIELLTGVVVNLWLHLNVWDYSDVPGNFLGQICLKYSVFWFFLSAPCIKVYNWIEENVFSV